MGLPDVAPMQEAMLKEMQEKMMRYTTEYATVQMMKAWLPMSTRLVGCDLQKKFWTQMTSVAGGKGDDPSGKLRSVRDRQHCLTASIGCVAEGGEKQRQMVVIGRLANFEADVDAGVKRGGLKPHKIASRIK